MPFIQRRQLFVAGVLALLIAAPASGQMRVDRALAIPEQWLTTGLHLQKKRIVRRRSTVPASPRKQVPIHIQKEERARR
ncbi:MAG: hypothetical protein ACI80V_002954 [Rhodothermales bacterium]|jgi:hypothetical protein